MSEIKNKGAFIYLCFLGTAIISLLFWSLPDKQVAIALNEAGTQIRAQTSEDVKIIGHWRNSIGITLAAYGWDFDKLSSSYIEKKNPTTSDLLNTGEDSLIIVKSKKDKLRAYLIKLGIPWFQKDDYDPLTSIRIGAVRKIIENDSVIIYRWDKNS